MKYVIWAGYAVAALFAAVYLLGSTGSEKTNGFIILAAWGFVWLFQSIRNEMQMHFFRVQRTQERILEELAGLKSDLWVMKNDN